MKITFSQEISPCWSENHDPTNSIHYYLPLLAVQGSFFYLLTWRPASSWCRNPGSTIMLNSLRYSRCTVDSVYDCGLKNDDLEGGSVKLNLHARTCKLEYILCKSNKNIPLVFIKISETFKEEHYLSVFQWHKETCDIQMFELWPDSKK